MDKKFMILGFELVVQTCEQGIHSFVVLVGGEGNTLVEKMMVIAQAGDDRPC